MRDSRGPPLKLPDIILVLAIPRHACYPPSQMFQSNPNPTPSSQATFADLRLHPALLEAVSREGYQHPSPIQKEAIPRVLTGRDLLACAQTGTGKTAAFALPILQLLDGRSRAPGSPRDIRVLVLTPTRELASQIGDGFKRYGAGLPFQSTVIFGGVGQYGQEQALRKRPEIVVATPGRLLDLMGQGIVRFTGLEILVLDEADRMLDMGFIHDVRRVISALPRNRQTLFFSATMPPEISKLASQILIQPDRVEVTPVASTAEKIAQSVYQVPMNLKTPLLIRLLEDQTARRVLVFTRTKRDANRVSEALNEAWIPAAPIHGNKSQGARERALAGIKAGELRVLVATDIAARGIDIDEVTHVFNHDIPNIPETYVHRIGRTARAGREGVAISFCAPDERGFLRDIERLTRKKPQELVLPEGLEPEVKKRRMRPTAPSGRPPRDRSRPAQSQRRDDRPAQNPRRDDRSAQGRQEARPSQNQRGDDRAAQAPRQDQNRPAPRQDQNRPARPFRSGRDRPFENRGPRP